MSDTTFTDDAATIIRRIKYITIATAAPDGQPWNTPVYSAFDSDYNFFWASDREGQHSRNIRENPRIFLAIYDSTVPEGTGRGVYIQATAQELTEPDAIRHALECLDGRVGKPAHTVDAFLNDMPRRVYQATPQRAWINGDGERNGHFIDIRTDISSLISQQATV